MECKLHIPVSDYGLFPVTTDSGAMDIELTRRTPTDTPIIPEAPCTIRAAIEAHLKAKKVTPDLPNSFTVRKVCLRCGDEVIFSAE